MTDPQRVQQLMSSNTRAELLQRAYDGGMLDMGNPDQWDKSKIAAVVADQEAARAAALAKEAGTTP